MALSVSRHVLINECRELLTNMETVLVELGGAPPTSEQINSVFRAAHTIKGSAGLLGLTLIVAFTHRMENVLDRVRDQKLMLDASLSSLLLRCGDYIWQLVDAVEQERETIDPDPALRQELLGLLELLLGGEAKPHVDVTQIQVRPSQASKRLYHISLAFDPFELKDGVDPISLIEYLAELGTIAYLHTLSDAVPRAEAFDPEACYLRFELGLSTSASQLSVENCLTFVHDERHIRILPPDAEPARYEELIKETPALADKLRTILAEAGRLVAPRKLEPQALLTANSPERLLANDNAASPKTITKARPPEDKRGTESRALKVDAARLDELINLVGELVIASEGARTMAGKEQKSTLVEALHKVTHLVEGVRDRALKMRMVPIGEVFKRFPRVVREISRELGKQIEPVITGADTELDKSMVEKLGDPLLHIVRNAMDHGLEPSDVRVRAGKPSQGRLSLNAYHESGFVVIEIADDGRGLDTARIYQKAVERKLIAPDAQLSKAEIQQLIFAAGFSTAEQVTNMSGRGVGMDVVKRSVEQLRGEIEIESEEGQGTTFRIRLPLTLAIIDGFQVAVGKTMFVIPLDLVLECVDVTQSAGAKRVFNLRGEPLPYLRLRDVFRLGGARERRESMVVVEYGGQRVGLVVDRLLGDLQAVIKPLGRLFAGVRGVSSSTILGDGSVALILDVPAIMTGSLELNRQMQAASDAAE